MLLQAQPSGEIRQEFMNRSIHKDHRGTLQAWELDTIPFEVKRVFSISQVPPGESRANHGHYECEQYLYMIQGEATVVTRTTTQSSEFLLRDFSDGLFIPVMTWISLRNFSQDAVLLVFASRTYDQNDVFHSDIF
jgi:mannose-6-phosphate isomerase-like protein (cupin superfamily)